MAAKGWSARPRTEKFQIVFGVLGIIASIFLVLEAEFLTRTLVLLLGGLIGAGIGTLIAKVTGRNGG